MAEPNLTRSKLEELVEREGPWVTITTPLHGGGPLAKQDPIRYRNLVKDAEDKLDEHRANGKTQRIVDALRAIADDHEVFSAGSMGLVVFANPDGVELWHLPDVVQEQVLVHARPQLRQVLPIVSGRDRFYVVTLSLHGTRLFACDRFGAEEVPLPDDAPTRLEDAAGWEVEEDHLNYRSAGRVANAPRGKSNRPIYHGQGGGHDDRDVDVEKYVRAVVRSVEQVVTQPDAPVVLACDRGVEQFFRRLTSLGDVIEPALHGNFQRSSGPELHARAWECVEERFARQVDEALDRFAELHDTGRTTDRLEEVVALAHDGRVDTLFVRAGASVLGRFDVATHRIHLEQSGIDRTDLLDQAAMDTFLRDGKVHIVGADKMPSDSAVAAILRFAVRGNKRTRVA